MGLNYVVAEFSSSVAQGSLFFGYIGFPSSRTDLGSKIKLSNLISEPQTLAETIEQEF